MEGTFIQSMQTKRKKKKRFGQPKTEGETSTGNKTAISPSLDAEVIGVSQNEGVPGNVKKIKSEAVKLENSALQTKHKNKKKVAHETPVKGQKQAPNPLNEGKRARVIVRNLAFKCTKEELQKAFGKCGKVVDVHIPTKATGTRLGFGFVQFENKAQAGMAVAQLNGTAVAGRTVAVDWALPKNMYESRVPAKPANVSTFEDQPGDKEEEEEEDMDVDVELEAHDVSDNHEKTNFSTAKSENDQRFVKNNTDDPNEESDEGSDSEGGQTSDEEDDENEEEDSDDSGIDKDKTSHKTPSLPERPSDVGEGRTVFIRNLPFSTDEEEIEECFSQYGEVKYACIVKDRNSGMSKGTAFVQFVSKDSASTSVEAAANEADGGLSLQGRALIVSLAVSREQAGTLSKQKEEEKKNKKKEGDKKEEKDSRNLYLSREGMIRPGTEAAQDVPANDLALRTKIAEANRQKLKDQNVFVSSTRLCIHNIPATIDDAKLRKIVTKAVGDRNARINECRIMRDLTRVNTQGQGKSKGFAFCSFTQHAHALAALKALNNCPTVFGSSKRPIVEFSLENRKALEAKQKRLEKSKFKAKLKPDVSRKNQQQQSNKDKDSVESKKKKWRQRKTKQEAKPLEVKKQQDKIARSMYEGPMGLPSHSGPKQRHKPRPGQQAGKNVNHKTGRNDKKTKFGFKGNNPREKEPKQKKMKNSKKRRQDVDGFDKLVASYKQKIMSSAKF